jgi:Xaa-Pro dipeptidase
MFTISDIQQRRAKVAQAWDAILNSNEAILVYSGEPISKPGGLDQTYTFIPHPAYYWLTGRRRESEVVLYAKDLGWIEFQLEINPEEMIWEGERTDLLVSQAGRNISELTSFLESHKFENRYELGQAVFVNGKAFELRKALDRERRKKDASEVKLISRLADIANFGYQKIADAIRPGITEREIQIIYETEIYRHGSHTTPYDSIVGAGTNSAILHALPTNRVVAENEFVLVDAGADIYDYCVDITRTYFSSGSMSGRHKDLYELVLKAYTECAAMCMVGVQWRDVHSKAAHVITEGLMQLGILRGTFDELIEKEVVSLFFPHGVGHLVGLRVRDAGQEENIHPKTYFGARLRIDLALEEDNLVTVEPGCYFIASILNNVKVQDKFKSEVNWSEVEKWKNIGGVRIEDNFLVKQGSAINLTNVVKKN